MVLTKCIIKRYAFYIREKGEFIMKNEVWKTYPEFDFIQGSSLGRVRTIDRVVSNGKGTRLVKGRVLKQQLDKDGYLYVLFKVNGKTVARKVHRIVAQTFIPNPDNLPQANHKDCDRTNNNVKNLEWCTASYNMQYREKYGVSNTESLGHPLFAVNLTTLEVSRFCSQHEAGRELNAKQGSINGVIKGRLKQTGGYWFTNADNNAVDVSRNKFGDKVANKIEKLMKRNANSVK